MTDERAESAGNESGDRDPYTPRDDPTGERMTDDGATDDEAVGDALAAGEVGGVGRRVFWADAVADRIEAQLERSERDPDGPVVIKGGVSPSGVPHLGHANEVMRGHFLAEVLRERDHEVRQVFTADDRDPLRKVPRTLADLDWNVMTLGETPNPGALGRNLGTPLTDVPDPFGCCDSFGDHQTALLASMADALGVAVEVVSTTDLYESGAFEAVTRELLEKREAAREVLSAYQDKVDAEYVPFNPICGDCGKITETVTGIDPDAGTVAYACTDLTAGDRVIEGCGHEGTAALREGKLPWRFEWPAQWQVLNVDFEPFGKDHAEGSWPSGEAIAREVLGFEPPVPMVYEWFTLDGEPLSSSSGHVITVPEVLELLEREVLWYFFAKDPTRARDFDVSRLDQLVDEFDRFERVYFCATEAAERERRRAERVYPLLVDDVREERVRLPYTFAAVLGMTDDADLRERMARREGHLDDAPEWAVEDALGRVERARTWASRTGNEYDYRLAAELPATDFEAATERALDDLASAIEDGSALVARSDGDTDDDSGSAVGEAESTVDAGETLQGTIYETARAHDIDIGDFFAAGYRLFFDEQQGPRLGPFLAELDREFVVRRLRREG
jgi:lysyl-tRNA synthetase class 1